MRPSSVQGRFRCHPFFDNDVVMRPSSVQGRFRCHPHLNICLLKECEVIVWQTAVQHEAVNTVCLRISHCQSVSSVSHFFLEFRV